MSWQPSSPIPVTVLGATGVVGQRFVRRLANHPWFTVRYLAASDRSADRPYGDACTWRLPVDAEGRTHGGLGDHVVSSCDPEAVASPIVFSALDTGPARELEPLFARAGCLVFSNASAYRMTEDVPLLIPEVNADHLGLLARQRRERGWSGGIVCNPNCTSTILTMVLAPLHRAFGLERVLMTSMQALSGAGYPGVASLDALGNVVPYIRSEEDKVEEEPAKMLGGLVGDRIVPASFVLSAMCNRVAVLDGHTETLSLELRGNPSIDQVRDALRAWEPAGTRDLPSAPPTLVHVHDADDRPQPRLDVERDAGMSVHVGRIRRCPVLGTKLVLLGNNVERGAAGASVLNAELALRGGYLA
ncbi:MAG: aspartate-semialdehyde dehydrogenase [Planctomycetes bacterium]|nr:aspartate-semialdehyde dehydrogenase [Planctomycetota bacterium]